MVPFTPKEQEESVKAKRMLKGTFQGLLMTAFLMQYSQHRLGKSSGLVSQTSANIHIDRSKQMSFVLTKKVPGRMKEGINAPPLSGNPSRSILPRNESYQGPILYQPAEQYFSAPTQGAGVNISESGSVHSDPSKLGQQSSPQSQTRLQVRSIQYQASRPLRASMNWKDHTPSKPFQNSQSKAKPSQAGNESLCGDSLGEDVATNDSTGKPQTTSIRKDSNPSSFFRLERESGKLLTVNDLSEDGRMGFEEGSIETNQERFSTPATWAKTKLVTTQDWKDISPGFSPASLAESLKPLNKESKHYPSSQKASFMQQASQHVDLGSPGVKTHNHSAASVPRNLDVRAFTNRGVRFNTKNGEYFAANPVRLGNNHLLASAGSVVNSAQSILGAPQEASHTEARMGPRSNTWVLMPPYQPEGLKVQLQLKDGSLKARSNQLAELKIDKPSVFKDRQVEKPSFQLTGAIMSSRAGTRVTQSVIINPKRASSPENIELRRVKATPKKKITLNDGRTTSPVLRSTHQTLNSINLPTITTRNPYSSPVSRK